MLSEKIKVMREIACADVENSLAILKDIYNMVDENESVLKECYDIDREETNKKEPINFKRILDIIQEVIDYKFPDIQIHEMIDERRIVEFKQNTGVIGVIYNGDIYATIELIVKALKTNNAIILNIGLNDNIGTNNIIVKCVKEILQKNGKSQELVEINFSENEEIANEDLDQLIIIGDREKQVRLSSLNFNTIKSGYGYAEIYLDELEYQDFVSDILTKTDYEIKIYIKDTLDAKISGIRVKDCQDAINHINHGGSGYAAAIFSKDSEVQRMFMKRIKNKYIFVNASPTIARELDVKIEDMYNIKIGMV